MRVLFYACFSLATISIQTDITVKVNYGCGLLNKLAARAVSDVTEATSVYDSDKLQIFVTLMYIQLKSSRKCRLNIKYVMTINTLK